MLIHTHTHTQLQVLVTELLTCGRTLGKSFAVSGSQCGPMWTFSFQPISLPHSCDKMKYEMMPYLVPLSPPRSYTGPSSLAALMATPLSGFFSNQAQPGLCSTGPWVQDQQLTAPSPTPQGSSHSGVSTHFPTPPPTLFQLSFSSPDLSIHHQECNTLKKKKTILRWTNRVRPHCSQYHQAISELGECWIGAGRWAIGQGQLTWWEVGIDSSREVGGRAQLGIREK